jgi:hypothetical protein
MRIVHSKLPDMPSAWIQAAKSAPTAIAADTLDDRVSESILDVVDEWTEIDIIAHNV